MARRLQQRHPKILHGLDMSAIIEDLDEDNDGESNEFTPSPTSRPCRTTRQRINGEAPALYSAKYHPMDDVMRPAAAKRSHGEAFERNEDTDDPEECLTDVGSSDVGDQENSRPARRMWSTGIRHSGRLDAPSRKPVDYNMKRHPQDAQLRMLDNSSSSKKRARPASYKYTVHRPDLLGGDDESSEEEDGDDDDEQASVGDAPIPTKRVTYSVKHTNDRRSITINDSDDKSSSDEDFDKENTPPTAHMVDVETDAEEDDVDAASYLGGTQMVDKKTPLAAHLMDIETDAEDDDVDAHIYFDENQMVDQGNNPLAAHTMKFETNAEENEASSNSKDDAAAIQSDGNHMTEKEKAPSAGYMADDATDTENDGTFSPSKADDVPIAAQYHLAEEVEMDIPAPKSLPDTTTIHTDEAEAELPAPQPLANTTTIQPMDRETRTEAKARLLVSPLPAAILPSSSSSKTDDDILGALEMALTATQQEKAIELDGMNKGQAPPLRVSLFRYEFSLSSSIAINFWESVSSKCQKIINAFVNWNSTYQY